MNKYLFEVTLLSATLSCASFQTSEKFIETLHQDWEQTFLVEEKIYEEKTPEQELLIFTNPFFGKVLALDGAVQLTERDESFYHEMMAHVPLLSHGYARHVLVIGGGDGGMIREVLRHRSVEKVTLVEIDPSVIDFSKKYLPKVSRGAFEDPRVEVIIDDGSQFVKKTAERFDVIICDSPDPIGPGVALFTSEFYRDCHHVLKDGGIFINHFSVPFMQENELSEGLKNLRPHFKDVSLYLTVVPTYVGGFMALSFATDHPEHREVSLQTLQERVKEIQEELHYYTPEVHKAAFALPQFIKRFIK